MEASSDGDYVKAEDAINREAVNADRIRVLELQLREAKELLREAKERGDREYAITVSRGAVIQKMHKVLNGEL